MKKRITLTALLLTALALALAGSTLLASAPPPATKTLSNLQEAYNGESNAHARYLAFAARADEEGYTKVASIFRAAARAESIHADNHAAVIRALGGVPKATIVDARVASTAENLKAAIEGESYERDTMYPEFLTAARSEGVTDAIRSFNFALDAEAGHAQLYKDALTALARMKGGELQLYVCPTCGRTLLARPDGKCPVCFSEGDTFIRIA